MTRPIINPRSFSDDYDLDEIEELARTVQETIDAIPVVTYRLVENQVASGTAGTEMAPIAWSGARPPMVAHIVRIRETRNPTADVSATVRMNFGFEDSSVVLYEPSGLTAGTSYDFVVMFVEAG